MEADNTSKKVEGRCWGAEGGGDAVTVVGRNVRGEGDVAVAAGGEEESCVRENQKGAAGWTSEMEGHCKKWQDAAEAPEMEGKPRLLLQRERERCVKELWYCRRMERKKVA